MNNIAITIIAAINPAFSSFGFVTCGVLELFNVVIIVTIYRMPIQDPIRLLALEQEH
jgi:hypothetical protein